MQDQSKIDFDKYIIAVIDKDDKTINEKNPLFAMTRHSIRGAIMAAFEMEREVIQQLREGEKVPDVETLADKATDYMMTSILQLPRQYASPGTDTIH